MTPRSTCVFRAHEYSYEERVADSLAAELLMPSGTFENALRAYQRPSPNALRAMARIFDVSLTACFRRIIELPGCVAFTYVYDVGRTPGKGNVTFRGGYPKRGRLTLADAPSSIVFKCLHHASTTGRLWLLGECPQG